MLCVLANANLPAASECWTHGVGGEYVFIAPSAHCEPSLTCDVCPENYTRKVCRDGQFMLKATFHTFIYRELSLFLLHTINAWYYCVDLTYMSFLYLCVTTVAPPPVDDGIAAVTRMGPASFPSPQGPQGNLNMCVS